MFTDLDCAIEEAQYLKKITKKCHIVIQKKNGQMEVKQNHYNKSVKYAYSTAGKGVINV